MANSNDSVWDGFSLVEDRNVQLKHLERNQRDIGQFNQKLTSYLSEPKTYTQYQQYTKLKKDAQELEKDNKVILAQLRNHLGSTSHFTQLLQRHLARSRAFTKEVVAYMGEVNVERTIGVQ